MMGRQRSRPGRRADDEKAAMNNPAMTAPASQQLDNRMLRAAQSDDDSSLEAVTTREQLIMQASKNERGWRRIVRNLSPSWFSVTMGTGVVSILLVAIPWQADWLYYLSLIVFALNVVLFAAIMLGSILRYTIWPEIWIVMLQDSTNSLFMATMPMGLATIVQMWVLVCVPPWGEWAAYVAWAGWIIDSVLAVAVTITSSIMLVSASHQRSLDTITAAQLLPIAATVVAAAVGARVTSILTNPQHALATIIASYALWGMAVPMAVCVMVMYYQRLALHKMPPREVIVSVFLPLGPLGFGGFAILHLGAQARRVFPLTNTLDPLAGEIAYVMGFFVSLTMWSWALLWLCLAIAILIKTAYGPGVPFNMGWWGFTFPLGVLAISTIEMGTSLPSLFFRVVGTIFAVCVILLWIFIACGTLLGAWSGELFAAPCLKNLPPHKQAPELMQKDTEKATERPDT